MYYESDELIFIYQCIEFVDTNSTLHSDFPHDPKGFYEEQEAKVFALLHCTKQSILRDIAAQDQEQKDKLPESKEDYGAVGEERKGLNSVEGGGSRGVVDEVAREVFPTTSATAFSDEVDHTVVKNKNKNMDVVTDVPTSSTFPKEHHPISGHDKSCTGMGRGDSYSHCKSNWAGSDNGGDLSDPAKFSDKLFTNGSVCNAWGGDDREEFMSTPYSTSTDHFSPDSIAQMIPNQISNHDLWTTVSSTADTLNEFDRGGIINQSYRGDINGIMGQGRADINRKTDSRLSQPDSLLQSSLSIQPRPRKRGSSGFDSAAHQPSPSSVHYHTDRTHTPLKVSATKISRTVANSERGNCTASLRSLPQLPPGLHRSPAGTGVTSSKSDNIHGRGSISRSPISVRKRLRTDGPETDSSRREEIPDLSQNAYMYHSEKNQENSFPRRDQQIGFDRSSDSDMREIGADQNLFGVMSINNTSQLSDANTTQGSKLKQTQVQVQEPLATQDPMSTATAPSNIFLSSIGDAFDCEDW